MNTESSWRNWKPSSAMAVSMVALFVALSGTVIAGQRNSVGSRELKPNAVKSGHIQDLQVKNRDVRDVNWNKLTGVPAGFADGIDNTGGGGGPASDVQCTGCVHTADIATGHVTNSDLGNSSVNSGKVFDNSLTAADLAANSVGVSELAANAVRTGEILNGQVTAVDLSPAAFEPTDIRPTSTTGGPYGIAGNAISGAEVAFDTLTGADINEGTLNGGPLAGAHILADETVESWFNNRGGAPSVSRTTAGIYRILFPGINLGCDADGSSDAIVQATPGTISGVEQAARTARTACSNASRQTVRIDNENGSNVNAPFHIVIFAAN